MLGKLMSRAAVVGCGAWLVLVFGICAAGAALAVTAPLSKPGGAHSTADHSKFKELRGPFSSGPEVTKACLGCHTEAAQQLHKTTHWKWEFFNEATQQTLGKQHVINNFCVATSTNWARCTSCHIGYGWKDQNFDLSSEDNVDCLVCHDTTGKYKKFPAGAGHPVYEEKEFPPGSGKIWKPVDLAMVAQKVGTPQRKNCGACHFFGGGGDAVKHGDLDSTMTNPGKSLDVHMDVKGLNFSCQTCHTTGSHEVSGSRYVTKAVDRVGIDVPGHSDDTRATCESCHGLAPHEDDQKLNDHVDKVACETCHIPAFARGGKKTKMYWDWSTAGKLKDGKPYEVKGEDGYPSYDTKKGSFVWEADVKPEYYWFDGRIKYTLLGQKIDASGVVPINSFSGSYRDPDARIWPFKVMRGKQPYDSGNNILVVPHLFGKDDAAYWKSFDWSKAIAAGMESVGVPFSGQYEFVKTEYFWPITHMVATKDQALPCNACHAKDGRLANLTDFYLPGRDSSPLLDRIGWGLVLLTLAAVIGHALLRMTLGMGRR